MIFWELAEVEPVLKIAHFTIHIGMLYSYTEAVSVGEEQLRFRKMLEKSIVVPIIIHVAFR